MTRSQFLLPSLLALPLLAAVAPEETYDLTPRFEDGMELSVTANISGSFELDEASVMMGELDLLQGGVAVEFAMEATSELSEVVLESRDGALVKLRRTVETEVSRISGDFDAMGDSDSFDEETEGDTVGHTLEITIGEDGEVASVEDVSEEDLEALDDEVLEGQEPASHYEELLPTEPVEVGDSWDPSEGFMESITEEIRRGAEEAGEQEETEVVLDLFERYARMESSGTLASVEDGIATIEWEITFSLEMDDLLAVVAEIAGEEELADMPENAEASMQVLLSIEGTGSFDLGVHQLTSIVLEGSMSMEMDAAASQEEMELEASASGSGSFEITGGVEVL